MSSYWNLKLTPLHLFAIILKRKRKLVALFLLSYRCLVTVNVVWLFLAVLYVGLQCVIVVFPDHTHLFLSHRNFSKSFKCKAIHFHLVLHLENLRKRRLFSITYFSLTPLNCLKLTCTLMQIQGAKCVGRILVIGIKTGPCLTDNLSER